jgi:hypothetical protein
MFSSPSTKLKFLILAAIMFPVIALAGTFEEDFVVVFIDAKTEAEFGSIPLNREVLAKGIDRIASAGARGLVLKFFLDQAKDEQGDRLLERALSQLPTVLQARLDNSEQHPNVLAGRFTLMDSFEVAASGSSGWVPLPRFAKNAKDIGFVDFNSTTVPMIEQYQSMQVKSLILCAIELAAGKRAVLHPGSWIAIGPRVINVNARNQAIARLDRPQLTHVMSFVSLLKGGRGCVQPQ